MISLRDKIINHFKKREYETVLTDFEKKAFLFENDDEILCIVALAYSCLKKYDQAISYFIKAFKISDKVEYKYNLAKTYAYANQVESAKETYKQIISDKEDHLPSLINLSDLLIKDGEYDAALNTLQKHISENEENTLINYNYALALSQSRKFAEAIKHYNKVIEIEPLNRDALYNMANCYYMIAQFDQAIDIYQKIVSEHPEDHEAKFNLGISFFMVGDHAKGLELYESRHKLNNHSSPNLNLRGKSLLNNLNVEKNSPILIIYEQGFGDTINFSYLLNELNNMFSNIQVLVQNELYDLFKQSFKNNFITDINKICNYDYYIFTSSLPLFFFKQNLTLQSKPPFLKTSDEYQQKWRSHLVDRDRRKIGISWRSKNRNMIHRDIDYHNFLHALPESNDYYCLQKDVSPDEIEFMKNRDNFFDFSNKLNNFHDTASLCLCMDEIISIDTVTAHLSLGLGLKTTLLLSRVPDWRWGFMGNNSIWYPKIEILRQTQLDNWNHVIDEVCEYLK